MSEVYGILGNKGHGKDTFAKLVQEANPNFKITHFAKSLKEMAGRVFGLTHDQLYNQDFKEVPLSQPIEMDIYLEQMRKESSLPLLAAGKVATNPREVLQYLGTEYVRRAQDDFWIQMLTQEVQEAQGTPQVLIPDTRFINEAKALKRIGAHTIKIVRTDQPKSADTHSSEVEMATIPVDLTLEVGEGDFDFLKRSAQSLVSGGIPQVIKDYLDRTSDTPLTTPGKPFAGGLASKVTW